jgi:integrase
MRLRDDLPQRPQRLTAKAVENAKPSDTRREIADAGCKGLYLILQPSGARSWAVRYRHDGRTRKLTLDGFPSLADARRRCMVALHQLEQGIDPAEAKFKAKTLAAQADSEKRRNTVEQLAQRFFAQHVSKLRPSTQVQVKHVFDDIVLPRWHGRPVTDIARRDVRELIEEVAAAGTPIMANRTLGWTAGFFNWLIEHDVLAANPCTGIKPATEQARDRVLDDDEIRSLWEACEKVGGPGAACVRLMLLLGQRRGEIAGMQRRAEINGDLWTIPAQRMKGKVAHTLPLPQAALTIIERQPVFDDSDFVFSFDGGRPFNAFAELKQRLDQHMQAKAPWTFHDVRRSVASHMAGLGEPVEVIEKVLAHRSNVFRGIVSTYQRHSYVPQMRAALERWSERVDELVRGVPPSRVIDISRRR